MNEARFRLEHRGARCWHLTFDHPPIKTFTAATVAQLAELVGHIEANPELVRRRTLRRPAESLCPRNNDSDFERSLGRRVVESILA